MRLLLLKIIFCPWAMLLAITLIAPISYGHRSLIVFFILGCILVIWAFPVFILAERPRCFNIDTLWDYRLNYVLKTLFWIFILASYSNFFLLEGKSLFNLVEQRELANVEGASPSILGGISALLASTPAFYMSLQIMKSKFENRRILNLYFIVLISVPPLLFSGGRNPMVLTILFLIIVKKILDKLKNAPPSKRKGLVNKLNTLLLIIGSSFAMIYVLYIALARRIYVGNYNDYVTILTNEYNVQITQVYLFFEQIWIGLAVVYTSLYYYVTHGLVFFDKLIHSEGIEYTYGFLNFPLYVSIWDFIFDTKWAVLLSAKNIYPGSYLSLFGGYFHDFGVLGLIFISIFIFFILCILLVQHSWGILNVLWLSMASLFILISPIYSLTSTGFGSSIFFIIILLSFLKPVLSIRI